MAEKFDKTNTYPLLNGLFLLFLGLKLASFIDWSWWAIFMPFIFKAFLVIIISLIEAKGKEK